MMKSDMQRILVTFWPILKVRPFFFTFEILTNKNLYGTHSISRRTLVIHGGEDYLGQGGDPGNVESVNAGPRRACGIVQSETGKITIFEAHFTQI